MKIRTEPYTGAYDGFNAQLGPGEAACTYLLALSCNYRPTKLKEIIEGNSEIPQTIAEMLNKIHGNDRTYKHVTSLMRHVVTNNLRLADFLDGEVVPDAIYNTRELNVR